MLQNNPGIKSLGQPATDCGKMLTSRNESRGDPFLMYEQAAAMCEEYLDYPLNFEDLMAIMCIVKMCRQKFGQPDYDNPLDIIGYSDIWATYLSRSFNNETKRNS